MIFAQYEQYTALNGLINNLISIQKTIEEKVPTQFGEYAYDYNRALTAQIRKDLFDVIEKHKTNIKNLMEDL